MIQFILNYDSIKWNGDAIIVIDAVNNGIDDVILPIAVNNQISLNFARIGQMDSRLACTRTFNSILC